MPPAHDPTAAERLTLPDLLAGIRTLGVTGCLPESVVAPTQSDLTHALAWQLAQRPDIGSEAQALTLLEPPVVSGLAPLDVRALLHGTLAAARARGIALGHRRPANAVQRLRRALGHIVPWVVQEPRLAAAPEPDGPTEFHRLAMLVVSGTPEAGVREDRRRRQLAWNLRGFGRRAAAHGVTTVADLPTDYDGLSASLTAWGFAPGKRAQAVSDLRAAQRLLAGVAGAPPMPTWTARSARAAVDDLLATRLPRLAEDLALWEDVRSVRIGDRALYGRDRSPHAPLRETTAAGMRAGLRQWAAALVALVDRGALIPPVPLEEVDLESLFTEVVARPRRFDPTTDDLFAARRVRRLGTADAVVHGSLPLALAVIDLALDHELWPKARRDAVSGRWPKHAAQMAFRLWAMAERVALRTYGSEHAEPVRRMQAVWRTEVPGLKDALSAPCSHRDARGIVRRQTLPHLVCFVLPWWTLHHLPTLRAAAQEAGRHAHRGPTAAARAHRARAAYRTGLAQYQALVTFVADPWRIGNARQARVGAQIVLEARWSSSGSLEELTKVVAKYPGDTAEDLPVVRTKTGAERPEWRWSPVIADPKWLAEVLRELWLPALVDAGVATKDTTHKEAVASRRYPWFVNPAPRGAGSPGLAGGFRDEESIAHRFGDALLAGLRAMGVGPLPTCAARAAAEGFAFQFRPHILRTLWATYWVGVRGAMGPVRPGTSDRYHGAQVACAATGDTERTLRKHYAVVAPEVAEQLRQPPDSWRHPRAFDRQMDATWFHEQTVDWARLWRDSAFRALMPEPLQQLDLPGSAPSLPPRPPRRRRRSARGRAED